MTTPQTPGRIFVSNRQRAVKISAGRVRDAALAAVAYRGGPSGNLSVALVGDRKMRRLNRDFAGVEGTTDVLAFDLAWEASPASDDVAGEVVVNASLAAAEAARRAKEAADELLLYVVHGVLHLAGLGDGTPRERKLMRAAERSVMRRLAHANKADKAGGG